MTKQSIPCFAAFAATSYATSYISTAATGRGGEQTHDGPQVGKDFREHRMIPPHQGSKHLRFRGGYYKHLQTTSEKLAII